MELDFPDDDSVLMDGRRYVTARKISEQYGFSAKQLARLALDSKVNGEYLGRLWYISEYSLNEYIDDQIAANRRREEARPSNQKHR
jgi:hypothetical protein